MKMVMYGLAVVGSFALAAGGSWYLTKQDEAAEEQTDENAEGAETTEDGKSIEKPPADPDAPPKDPEPSAMPAKPMTAEDFVRHGVLLNKEKVALAKRAARLDKIERQQKLILLDIDAEQRAADGIFLQMRATLDASEKVLAQINEKKAEIEAMQATEDAEQGADGNSTTKVQADPKSIKNLAELYKNLEPDRASAIFTKMANDGGTERVVQIVNQLDKKKAAQVLDSMAASSPELVVQITDMLATLPQPVSTKKRR